MFDDPEGPVEHFSWFKFIIRGKEHSRFKGVGKDIMVIGNGFNGIVDISGKVIQRTKDLGILEIIVEHTPKACSTFNELHRKGSNVALLAHGTC